MTGSYLLYNDLHNNGLMTDLGSMREGQQFIGHCARLCQIVATTTGFVPHE